MSRPVARLRSPRFRSQRRHPSRAALLAVLAALLGMTPAAPWSAAIDEARAGDEDRTEVVSIPGAEGPSDGPALGDGAPRVSDAALALKSARAVGPQARVLLPSLDATALREEDARLTVGAKWKRWNRVGVVRRFPALRTPVRPSRWRDAETLPDGSRVWRALVSAPGAAGVRVQFRRCLLPKGAELTVSDADDPSETYGPLRAPADGRQLFAPTVVGERALVALRVPAEALDHRVDLVLDAVSHRYRAFDETWEQGPEPRASPLAATSLTCMNSIACDAVWAADVGRAVGRFEVTSRGSVFLCSGTLLNDSDEGSQVPFFLTANHCVGSDREAKTVEIWWDYRPSACFGIVPFLDELPRTVGATLLATSAYGDCSLLRLTGALPPGRYFAGWTTAVPTVGTDVVGVHHPQGTHMRISYGGITSQDPELHTVVWDDGVTAQGSSGSALFNPERQIVGQLCCGESFCETPRAPDDYGRFDVVHHRILRPHLGNGSAPAPEPDAWDPGDDTPAGATQLGTPTPQPTALAAHTLVAGDLADWFAVDLLPGEGHVLRAVGEVRGDLFRDAAGTNLAVTDGAPVGGGFALAYTPPAGASPVRHWLRVRRADPDVDVSYVLSTSRPTSTIPVAARPVRAVARPSRSVVLRWKDRAADELGYRVELLGNDGFVVVGRLPAEARRFVHAPGPGRHTYRVRPWNAAGEGATEVRVRVRGRHGLDVSDPADDSGAGATYLGSALSGATPDHELDKNDAADWYRIDLTGGVPCVLRTEGTGDTVGALFADAGGQDLLAQVDDVGADRNFLIEVTPPTTASYWLRVTAYPTTPRATYRLVWSEP